MGVGHQFSILIFSKNLKKNFLFNFIVKRFTIPILTVPNIFPNFLNIADGN